MFPLGISRTLYEGEVEKKCEDLPYRVFVIVTRLYPFLPLDVLPNISSFYNEKTNKMEYSLRLLKAETDEEVALSEPERKKIEDKIVQVTSVNPNYALINVTELYRSSGDKIPFTYFSDMLQYSLPTFDPEDIEGELHGDVSFIEKREGDEKEKKALEDSFLRADGIYLSFNPRSDYKKIYRDICKSIIEKIQLFYERGVIITNSEVASKWNLSPIDKEEEVKDEIEDEVGDYLKERGVETRKERQASRLYQPTWINRKYAPNMVDFLLQRTLREEYITFSIPDNYVRRHDIVANLQKQGFIEFFIEGSSLKVKSEDYETAEQISSLVNVREEGRVMLLASYSKSFVYLYTEYANKKKYGESISYYQDRDIVYSLKLFNTNVDTVALSQEFYNYAVNRLLETTKLSKFKGMSPNEIIEKEYS